MISRFFIDRPIFATVLSIVITLIGGIALRYLPIAQYPRITPPGVVISISYPGASSEVVADTVAAPIEQQVNGVPGMLYMSSQMGNDGSYSLQVTFDIGVDLKTALVMVQNRVALAMPQLPTAVQNQGITIRKKTPDMLMIVNFTSPDGRYDDIYLSNFATINVRDELLRVPGVSDINVFGQRDYSIRVWLNPQELAARGMTAIDVANAIRSQNLDAPAGQINMPPALAGQAFQMPINTLGRLKTPEQFGDIVVKVTPPAAVAANRAMPPPRASTLGMPDVGTGPNGTDNTSSPSGTTTAAPATSASPQPITSTSNSSTGTTTTPALGINLSGGATSTGGGTIGGAANSSGGGTTGGAASAASQTSANTAAVMNNATRTDSTDTTSVIPSVADLTNGSTAAGGSAVRSTTPRPISTGVVHLRDVARIDLGAQNYNLSSKFDGMPTVGLGIYQLPGTNALEAADQVRAKMEELSKQFPEGVSYVIGYDTTPFIRESVDDVVITLLEAVALVGLVVLVFLQDWKAMILPLIDVPVSIIGTFAVMFALGFSLNNISLFGLVLAIGIVVDDAIVVLENIERLMARGMDARSATIKAMEEVTGPIVAVALVLCAVFVPCAFISGITGQFFHQFAVTISVSTVISAINAVTMTPSRAVLIFKTEEGKSFEHRREALPWWFFGVVAGGIAMWFGPPHLVGKFDLYRMFGGVARASAPLWLTVVVYASLFTPPAIIGGLIGWFTIRPVNAVLGWSFRVFNRGFDRMTEAYGWFVGLSMHWHVVVLGIYLVLVGVTYWEFMRAPVGFIPQQDQGRVIVSMQLPDAASLERTQEIVAKVDEIARSTPGVAHTVSVSGMSFIQQASSPNFASMFIVLDPFNKRQRPDLKDTAIMAKMRKRWADEVKGAIVTAFGAAPIPGLGAAGGFKLVIEDRGGADLRDLESRADNLVRKLKEVPGLIGVNTQFRARTPQLYLDIDRTKSAALGVSINDLNQTLDMFLGSLYVNSYNDFGRHWQVTVQAEGQFRTDPADINLFQVRNSSGQMVPLGTLVSSRGVPGPISVSRYNLYKAASISGNVANGFSTGDAIKAIEKVASDSLPITMRTEWTDLMFMQLRAGDKGLYVFLLAIVSVFLALSALYESWSLPLAVILVVPMCLLCSVAGIRWTDRDVNIFVQIGLLVLVGLACKNAILIVEFAKQMHLEGRSVFDATKEASRLRLRPILMTSFAFIFGVLPLVVASGAGAEMRRSLGVSVFSGMLGVTLFGIFLTPVFFYVIQGLGESRLFASPRTRRIGSCVAAGLMGLAIGFMLPKIGISRMPWSAIIGALTGVVVMLGLLELHRRIVPSRAGGQTPPPTPQSNNGKSPPPSSDGVAREPATNQQRTQIGNSS
jgi:multidrug efflux pump